MAMYIKPPTGSISLKTLESFVIGRLNFLTKIAEAKTTEIMQSIVDSSVLQSQYLIGGTQKDSVSHFTLRLILSKDAETSKFLLESEKILFNFRCLCMTQDELYRFLKSFNKFTTYLTSCSQNIDNLSVVLRSLLDLKKQCQSSWRTLAFRYFNQEKERFFQVPFQTVLPFVHKRFIVVKDGIAFVPYSQLPVYLTEIFSMLLELGIKEARIQENSDERLNYVSEIIMKRCGRFLRRDTSMRGKTISHLDKHSIDEENQRFPPCMKNLHQTLRERHRLNHHARIQYTLYLKEMGLGVEEAIEFWKAEYSRPVRPDTEWGQNWNLAGQRYTYNIRHLYGLEGSRKNYRGHCCQSIQNQVMKPTDTGGCPFVHFDQKHFNILLTQQNFSNNETNHLVNLKNSGKLNEACAYYRDCVLSKSLQDHASDYHEISGKRESGAGAKSFNYEETKRLNLDKLYISKSDQVCQTKRTCSFIDEENELEKMSAKRKLVRETTVLTNTKILCINRKVCENTHHENIEKGDKSVLDDRLLSEDNLDDSDDVHGDFECEHEDCPSQRESSKDCEGSVSVIERPLDYFISYQTLLHKLHQLS